MEKTPQGVEVLVPAYNASATIRATLRSIKRQTVPIERVTVVDDQSTDDTAAIVQSFDGIRYIRNERNLRCGGNWNRCLDLSTGAWVALLHADDLLMADWHARVLDGIAMAASEPRACIHVNGVRFRHGGGLLETFAFASEPKLYARGEFLRLLWRHRCYGIPTSACTVYPRRVLEEFGRFPADAHPNMPDVPYHWAMLARLPFVYDPHPCVMIRAGAPSQVSRTREAEHERGAIECLNAALPELARALNMPAERVAGEYLFPYYVKARLRRRAAAGQAQEPSPPFHLVTALGYARLVAMAAGWGVEMGRRRLWLARHGRRLLAAARELDGE